MKDTEYFKPDTPMDMPKKESGDRGYFKDDKPADVARLGAFASKSRLGKTLLQMDNATTKNAASNETPAPINLKNTKVPTLSDLAHEAYEDYRKEQKKKEFEKELAEREKRFNSLPESLKENISKYKPAEAAIKEPQETKKNENNPFKHFETKGLNSDLFKAEEPSKDAINAFIKEIGKDVAASYEKSEEKRNLELSPAERLKAMGQKKLEALAAGSQKREAPAPERSLKKVSLMDKLKSIDAARKMREDRLRDAKNGKNPR